MRFTMSYLCIRSANISATIFCFIANTCVFLFFFFFFSLSSKARYTLRIRKARRWSKWISDVYFLRIGCGTKSADELKGERSRRDGRGAGKGGGKGYIIERGGMRGRGGPTWCRPAGEQNTGAGVSHPAISTPGISHRSVICPDEGISQSYIYLSSVCTFYTCDYPRIYNLSVSNAIFTHGEIMIHHLLF